MIERRPALGKGLSALIPEAPEQPRQGTFEVDIDLLDPERGAAPAEHRRREAQ